MSLNYLEYCLFPRHEEELWTDVIEKDRGYVEWLVSLAGPEDLNPILSELLLELLED